MKKVLLLVVPLLLALLAGLYQGAYACIGHWLYANATDLEARIYGFSEERVNIGDMELALYRNHNPGKPAIVMLHGFSADKDVWPRFAKHFVDDYQVIIPDLAGHGDTGFKPGWDYGMPAQAARVMAVLDALDIGQAHISGNSMGGFLTAAGTHFPQPSDMFRMLEQGINPFLIHNQAEFQRFYPMTMAQPPFLPNVVLAAVGNKYIARRDELQTIFSGFHNSPALDERLPELSVPAMLWWGDQDRLLHVSAVEVWQAGVPQLQTHIFAGIGHMPMVEIPARSARIYREFLQGL